MSTSTLSVPRGALRLRAGKFNVPASSGTTNEASIRMLARSPEAIEHWYWGRVVHDLAGMRLRKDRLPIDWCHDYEENIGYLDQFTADPKTGLTVAGKLLSMRDDDKAAEVIRRGQAGVPYEASIDFDGPIRVEEIGEGVTAKCNGRTIVGPAKIIREWRLNAVAVCPFGADPNTVSQFSASRPGDVVQVQIVDANERHIRELSLRRGSESLARFAAGIRFAERPQSPAPSPAAAAERERQLVSSGACSPAVAKFAAGLRFRGGR